MAFISQVIGFAIALGSGVTSNTATISTVDTTRSCIMWGGQVFSGGNVSAGQYLGRAELTNSTTVTATRGVGTNTLTVYGTVVEFDASVITSLEQSSVTIANSATSGTATISTIADTTKAVLFYHGHEVAGANTSGSPINSQCALDLTNSTTVTAERNTAVSDRTVTAGFTVIEFDSSFIAAVEKRAVTLNNTNATDTDTITSVTTSRAFLVWNGFTTNNGTASNGYTDITLTGATQVTLTRSGTTSASRTIKYTVVELQSGVLDSVEQGTTAVNSVASNTTTITTVDTSRSYLNFQGFNTNAGTQQNTVHHAEVLTNSTTVTVSRNTASTTTAEGAWSVLQFSAGSATNVNLTGVSGTGAAGTLAKTLAKTLTGVAGTGQAGTVTATLAQIVNLTGVSGTGQAGTLTEAITKALTGVAGTGAAGTVTASEGGVTASLTGVFGAGAAGTLATNITAQTIYFQGVGAVGLPGIVTTSGDTGGVDTHDIYLRWWEEAGWRQRKKARERLKVAARDVFADIDHAPGAVRQQVRAAVRPFQAPSGAVDWDALVKSEAVSRVLADAVSAYEAMIDDEEAALLLM